MIIPEFINLLNRFFNIIFIIAVTFTAGVIIYTGILYITSSDSEKLKKVHDRWKLIFAGISIVFLSRVIPRLIEMFFK